MARAVGGSIRSVTQPPGAMNSNGTEADTMREASDTYEAGQRIRREVLGDEYVDRTLSRSGEFDSAFQRLVTEYCWGAIWGRDGLDRRQRSLNNLTLLAALNRHVELRTHVRGAITNGCSVEEIRETLLQVAVYAGIPAAADAFRIAREALTDMGKL